MRVAITGHQRLDDDTAWVWVENALHRVLSSVPPPLIGISSLAVGTDQLFAQLVLALAGQLRVVLPFADYSRTFDALGTAVRYEQLLRQASQIETLEPCNSDEESYLAAGRRVVELADYLIAVWDGQPARGLGGTADIVQFALQSGVEVLHLNPDKREITHHTGSDQNH